MIWKIFLRIIAVFGRVLRQMLKDYYMITMLFFGPLLTFWLLFVVFQESNRPIPLGVVLEQSQGTKTFMRLLEEDFSVKVIPSKEEGIKLLEAGELPAVLVISNMNRFLSNKVILEGTQPVKEQKILLYLAQKLIRYAQAQTRGSLTKALREYQNTLGLNEYQEALKNKDKKTLKILVERFQGLDINTMEKKVFSRIPTAIPSTPEEIFQISYLYGKKLTYFDSIAPTLISFLIFFVVFLVGGIAFLRERINKTLSRTFSTPIRDWQFILGYFCAFAVIIFLLVVGLQFFAISGLHIINEGSFLLLLVVNISVSFIGLMMGFVFSTLAKTEFQLVQWIPIVIIPQFIFSGIFDTSFLPVFVNSIGTLFPLHYASNAIVDIVIRGRGWEFIWPSFVKLGIFFTVLLILNSLLLKKVRQYEG